MREQDKTILELIQFSGITEITPGDSQQIGNQVADIWHNILPDEKPQKIEVIEGEKVCRVNAYPREFWPVVLNVIMKYYQDKRTTTEDATERPYTRLKDLIGTANYRHV